MISGVIYIYFFQEQRLILPMTVFPALVFFLRKRGEERKWAAVFLACFLSGCILVTMENIGAETGVLAESQGNRVSATGKVVELSRSGEEGYRICCLVEGEKLLLSYYRPLENYGQLMGCTISFVCTVEKPRGASNPRTFDYSLYLSSRGIYYIAEAEKITAIYPPKSLWDKGKNRIFAGREGFFSAMSLSSQGEGLLRGVLFGDTKGLEEDTYETFRRNGTAHVLAVSGLHIGMLYGIYRRLYRRKKHPALTVLFILLLLIYGTAALWTVSVTRAVALILLSMGGELLDRRYDFTTAVSAAAIFSVMKNPYVVFGASFQMSFLAVMSIDFFAPLLERRMGGWSAAAAVQLGLLPYMAYTFNFVSLAGLFSNIPVVFLISILVPVSICAFFLHLFCGLLLPGFIPVCEGLSAMVIKVNHIFASATFLSFDVASPPLWITVLVYGAGFYLISEHFQVYYRRKSWKNLRFPAAALLLAVMIAAYAGASPFDKASAVFVDVGQGDCLHLRTEEGSHILIDGGGSVRYNIGEKTLKPYLLKNGIGRVDLAAATHLHTDHYRGLTELKEVFPVKAFLTEGEAGLRISLGDSQWIDILWPEKETAKSEDENLNSLIFKVYMKGFTILVTGDITEEGERMLLRRYQGTDVLCADVLKVAHHGSPYSSCEDFIRAVNPAIAVIGVGRNNYGHPSEKVIEKMRGLGIMVYRTDRDGAVGIINKRGRLSVCTKNP